MLRQTERNRIKLFFLFVIFHGPDLHCNNLIEAFQSRQSCHRPSVSKWSRRNVLLWSRLPKVIYVDDDEATTICVETPDGNDVTSFQDEMAHPPMVHDSDLAGGVVVPDEITDESKAQAKYVMMGLLWITACLSSVDRVAMSVALVPMSAEFGYSDTIKGSISSLLSFGYALFIIPAGLLLSSISPRVVMAFGIAIWSIATAITPVAAGAVLVSVAPLLLVRGLVGAGESIFLPASQRFLTVWTAADEKSRALAFIFSGFQAGTIAAYLLSPVIMEVLGGWRELFYVYGAAGFLILIPWLTVAQNEPTTHIVPQQSTAIMTTSTTTTDSERTSTFWKSTMENVQLMREAPWKEIATSKAVWAMLLAHCAKNWGLYNSLAWSPTFYAEQYGIGVKESAWMSMMPSLAGAVGGFVAGTTADAVIRQIQDPTDYEAKTRIRNVYQAIGLFGPAIALGSLAINIPEQAWVAQLFLAASFAFQSFNSGGFEAANQEKAGPRWSGLLYSITSLPAVLMGTGAVYVTGRILDATAQDWSIVFGITAVINALGAVAFIALYDSKQEFE